MDQISLAPTLATKQGIMASLWVAFPICAAFLLWTLKTIRSCAQDIISSVFNVGEKSFLCLKYEN